MKKNSSPPNGLRPSGSRRSVEGDGDYAMWANRGQNGSSSKVHFEVGCPRRYMPLYQRLEHRIADRDPFFSLEFFPPRTANGVANFYNRVERYTEGNPFFADVTWHAAGNPGSIEKCNSSTAVALGIHNYSRLDTMLHITAAQYTKEESIEHLQTAYRWGIRNFLALRGDLPPDRDQNETHFRAVDMIRWIKEAFGDDVTICCAGYPTGHPEAVSYQQDLLYLKAKVEAGAHFIITQLFFENETFIQFVKDCRAIGITVPIIPGILPIMSYDQIKKLAVLSQLEIPASLAADLEPIQHDDDAVMAYGKERAVRMCSELIEQGFAPGIHMYTMNREAMIRSILEELGLWKKRVERLLPWEPHGINHSKRYEEAVRPIYWSCRPMSYIFRTQDWDEYPNGRWGNSSSPCFASYDHYLFKDLTWRKTEKMRQMFGEPQQLDDIKHVFTCFVEGSQQRDGPGTEVESLPWSEGSVGVAQETSLIKDQLLFCISRGLFTINSQPNVDGVPSSDPILGWGPHGGYCYQRAYLEFFCPLEMAILLSEIITKKYNERISYHCISQNSRYEQSNVPSTTPIAVTWGVFPGREIAQPTVVDPLAFLDWKDEAFKMWHDNWGSLYEEGTIPGQILKYIHDKYILFTMVDNDFKQNTVIYQAISEAADLYDQKEANLGLGLDNYIARLDMAEVRRKIAARGEPSI